MKVYLCWYKDIYEDTKDLEKIFVNKADAEEYARTRFYINIEEETAHEYIPIKQLIEGVWYRLDARNLTHGQWEGKYFVGIRTKWKNKTLDKERHWDAGPPYGTAKPLYECKV